MAIENEPHLSDADKAIARMIMRGEGDNNDNLRAAERFIELAKLSYRLQSELDRLDTMLSRVTPVYDENTPIPYALVTNG